MGTKYMIHGRICARPSRYNDLAMTAMQMALAWTLDGFAHGLG